VEAGGRVVLNPTNGSSFTGTIVQTQQVASSRMRAIETGRWVAQVAPTGFTAVIDDHGDVLERSRISEQVVIQRQLELREGLTIYTRFGNLAAVTLALVLIVAGWAVELTRPRRDGARTSAGPGTLATASTSGG
jgi:apolipoprotein N-acyltransferase